jgi:UDP-N-acetylmuramoylalanine--D-glutamate ligase
MITITSFADKLVGVFGLGRSGLSAVRALTAGGAKVWAWDDDSDARNTAKLSGIELTDLYQSDWSRLNTLVLSPGISAQFPIPHILAKRAQDFGCRIISDIDLLAREIDAARFIGISGTNGKSTTTALIGHILKEVNQPVEIGGNYGIPALDLLPLDESGIYVLELSSYQLERIPSVKLDIAILLNISPDHIDRHGGMAGYVAAKKILFERMVPGSKAVIGMEDLYCRGICMELMIAQGCEGIVPISSLGRVPGGVYVDNGLLVDDLRNQQTSVMNLNSLTTLPGQHNWQNVAAAYAATSAFEVEPSKIISAIKTFSGLAHRQEFIRKIDGISFINDSKATNTEATAKALSCYDNIHWIVGGRFKEENLVALEPMLDRVSCAYLIGEAADQLGDILKPFISISKCGDLATAVTEANRKANLNKPSVVLLSPACASFDQFKNFEARGDAFRTIIDKLGIALA